MIFDESRFPFQENTDALTSTPDFAQSYNFGEQILGSADQFNHDKGSPSLLGTAHNQSSDNNPAAATRFPISSSPVSATCHFSSPVVPGPAPSRSPDVFSSSPVAHSPAPSRNPAGLAPSRGPTPSRDPDNSSSGPVTHGPTPYYSPTDTKNL